MEGEDSELPWTVFEQTRTFRSAKNRELLHYWSDMAGSRPYPEWRDIDLMALHRVATGLVVKDVEDGGATFLGRYWGRRLTEVLGIEATGRRHHEMYEGKYADFIPNFYRQVVAGFYPARLVSRIRSVPGKTHFKYEAIMLPLGGRETGVRHIIAHYDFDYVPTAAEKKALR